MIEYLQLGKILFCLQKCCSPIHFNLHLIIFCFCPTTSYLLFTDLLPVMTVLQSCCYRGAIPLLIFLPSLPACQFGHTCPSVLKLSSFGDAIWLLSTLFVVLWSHLKVAVVLKKVGSSILCLFGGCFVAHIPHGGHAAMRPASPLGLYRVGVLRNFTMIRTLIVIHMLMFSLRFFLPYIFTCCCCSQFQSLIVKLEIQLI